MQSMSEFELLALESSSERRRELLRGLTDMFLDGIGQATDAQAALFSDVVCKVLDDVLEDARGELAERIAEIPNFPKDVVCKLADDVIAVALPILEKSSVLSEEDLVAIASEKGQEHLLAISKRDDLREAVTDVLVQRGEGRVLHSVTANANARFSEEGFETLTDKAAADTELQEQLVGRVDMPRQAVRRLESVLTGELKQRMSTMRAMDLSDEINAYVSRAHERLEGTLKDSRRERIEVQVMLNEIKKGALTLDAAVSRFARENRPVHLGWLLAAAADLPENIVTNTLVKPNGLPIAVTCRALGLKQETFVAISVMRGKRLKLQSGDVDRLAEQYSKLHMAEAQRTLRFLKLRHGIGGTGDNEGGLSAA